MAYVDYEYYKTLYGEKAISEADFNKTFWNNMWWVAAQFLLQVIVLMGLLPIIGM